MAQPVFRKVASNSPRVTVYNANGGIGGYLYANEVYVDKGITTLPGEMWPIFFYSSTTKAIRTGYLPGWQTGVNEVAFAYGKRTSSGWTLKVRSGMRARIYSGTTHIASVYGNGTDGVNIPLDHTPPSGKTYPDRLKIQTYKNSAGNWVGGTDLWCDTDVFFGYPHRPTVYPYEY